MKLLIYSHVFAPNVGGVETIVRSLASGLGEVRAPSGERQFDITLVTQTAAGDFDDARLGFRVVRKPRFRELRRLIAAADVVHAAGPAILPMILSIVTRKPLVVEHHGFQAICPNGQLLIEPGEVPCPGHFMAGRHAECWRCNAGQGWVASAEFWLLTFMRRFLCARAAVNITPTRWLGELIQLRRTTPIPHGLSPRLSERHTQVAFGPPRIVFQGRLVTTKGVRVLLDAVRLLAEKKQRFDLVIIGDGPERASLEQVARDARLDSQVRFLGRLEDSELEEVFAGASAVVVPSLSGEVFGLVVAENMQRGLPVVASDLGAFTEVLGDCGIIFRTGDAQHLAEALESVLRDRSRSEDLGYWAAARISERFSLRVMVAAHAAVYREIAR
jgi:glycosyltransferase involved in cell wall biosynthesis